jgi:Cytochrome P460
MTTRNSKLRQAYLFFCACLILSIAAVALGALYAAESPQYPETFRRWVHVGTGIIMPGGPLPASEEGMHHVFANPKAVEGYETGDFADGSVIVYELRETQQKDGVIFEGGRRRVDAMIKNSHLYASTGGWRFERFYGNDQAQDVVHDSGSSCFECHSKVKAHGFVFTQLH